MMDACSFEMRQLLHDLVGKNKAARKAAFDRLRTLPSEAQLQLMGYAPQLEAEKPSNSLLRRIFADITSGWPSPEIRLQYLCRSAVMSLIIDDVTDPRFVAPLLDRLIMFSGLSDPFERTRHDDRYSGLRQQPALVIKSVPLQIQILNALKRTLANRQAQDVLSLTRGQIRALLIPLNAPYRDVVLTLLVLDVLKQIGEEEAIPLLERIAHIEAVTDNMKRVQQAAQECVTCLRALHSPQAKTLLRAAVAGSSGELLRPAVERAEETPPEELLRSYDPKIS